MNEKMNGGISTMRGIFCRLSFQKGGITAETIAAQGFDGGIFSVDTRQLRNSHDRSVSALRRKLRYHGNFFASGTDSLRWTRSRGWLRTWCFMLLPYMRWPV